MFHKGRGKDLPDWPKWCYMPLAAAYAVVSQGQTLNPLVATDVGILGALYAWRLTKGIYRYDPDFFEAITDTKITGDIPIGVLYRLPEWCVYIEYGREGVSGFWTHLEHDTNDGRSELRFVLDCGDDLVPIPLHLVGNLSECLEATIREIQKQQSRFKSLGYPSDVARVMKIIEPGMSVFSGMVSLVLYLCSQNSEIRNRNQSNTRPHKTHTSKGAQASTTWDVGIRIGSALRSASQSDNHQKDDDNLQSHAAPRPHVRRAHWHTYMTGSGREMPTLKWLSPILVGWSDGVIPAIRNVEPKKGENNENL